MINPVKNNKEFLYIDNDGYNCFTMSLSSNIEPILKGKGQIVNFQIFTFFQEMCGIIDGTDIQITHNQNDRKNPIDIMIVGKK